MGDGFLLCNEINPKRSKILSRNIERMAVANALVTNEHPATLAQRFPAHFDKVLIDAPCSGEGMFRKNEDACGEWSQENVELCAGRQDEILDYAAQMLRPGGRLLVLEFSKCQPWFKPIYDFYSFRFMPWAGGVIAGDRESYRYLAESIRMHPDQPTFAGMMTDAGFERVSWKNMTFGICAMHIGFKPGA